MLFQRTLASVAKAVGVGLHSGRRVRLVLRPAPENTGIVFCRTDVNPPVSIKADALAVNDTRMATTVNKGPVAVSTIEHLMSAFSGLGIDNCYVDVDAPEIPLMDGSSATFVFLIRSAGVQEQAAPKRFARILKPVEVRDGDKMARLEPHFGFKLSFDIKFGHPAIDATAQHVDVDFDRDDYVNAVSRARTFGFARDVEMLRSMGLGRGGTLDSVVVLDDFRVLNEDGLRSEDEFAKHKVLDAMGDLYVFGCPLLAHYSAFKSGHALNNRLLRELLAHQDCWEYCTFQQEGGREPAGFAPVLGFA